MHALVAEAMRKAAIAWIGVAGTNPYPVWCLWIDDALYVVTGGDEQPTPGLAEAPTVSVSARGDHGGRIVSWTAGVTRVQPDDETWPDVALQLAGKRLNSSGSNEALVERWTTTAQIYRLVPADDAVLPVPDGSLAAPPAPTPAARRTAKPFRLHRVKKR
jgi:hypothetical protein